MKFLGYLKKEIDNMQSKKQFFKTIITLPVINNSLADTI